MSDRALVRGDRHEKYNMQYQTSLKISRRSERRGETRHRSALRRAVTTSRARDASMTVTTTTFRARRRRASRVALAVVFVLASASRALAVVPTLRGLPRLDDASFERETQASSGQTAGTWLVLFTDGDGPRGARAERALALAKDALLDDGVVAATIDARESPETYDRFRFVVKRTPSVVPAARGQGVRARGDAGGGRGQRAKVRDGDVRDGGRRARRPGAVDVRSEEIRENNERDRAGDGAVVLEDG